ncbi:uncharacterized protein BP5553_06023 [Venustampulla echinocandica]|uniref:Uncharacterized protein n=1 Tax=Venustampulla echinocandica TaxID=2656787 RepID=A0A370TMD0_9HELO|nr:uncharacterized protein BP5553_06023 [Venustampulla echinocandica]RDL36671.1 hypothetical protein BP5553_06023 [Venustampulla echinocandica]
MPSSGETGAGAYVRGGIGKKNTPTNNINGDHPDPNSPNTDTGKLGKTPSRRSPSFSGLVDQKRNKKDEEIRAAHNDQKFRQGMFGRMWNK